MSDDGRRVLGMIISGLFAAAAAVQLVQVLDEATDGQLGAHLRRLWARVTRDLAIDRQVAREGPFVYWEAVEALEEGSDDD